MSAPLTASSSNALARLAAAPVPPRPRRLVEAIHGLAVQALANPLKLVVVDLERELFKQAERARSSQHQSDLYAEMRKLRESGEVFATDFLDALAGALAGLRQPVASPSPGPDKARAFQTLTLVEDTDIDRDIVLHDIARREASRSASALQLLGQRFGVLATSPAYEVEQLPLGPYALCRMLREVGERLELGLDAQLELYRAFDRQVIERYSELLDKVNILLAHEGVLPGLVYQPYLGRPAGTRRGAPPQAADKSAAQPKADAARRPLTGWTGQASTSAWSTAMEQLLSAMPGGMPAGAAPAALPAGTMPQGGIPAGAAGATTGSMPGAATGAATGTSLAQAAAALAHDDDAAPAAPAAMSALHQMLEQARSAAAARAAMTGSEAGGTGTGGPAMGAGMEAMGGTAPGAESPLSAAPERPTRTMPAAAVMDVLGKLQLQAPARAGGHRRSVNDIRSAVLAQVRADHGPEAALSQQDTDTFDLLDMLYGQIQREVRNEAPASDLLVQLQVPVVRAALSDPSFFVRDQHPARELLNAVAESGATWLGDEDTDPALLQKLGQAVEKVVSEYNGDEAVFEAANEEVLNHFRSAAHKAEVAERRHVEAARGRERLEAAKQLATTTIEKLCEQRSPPKFVQALLRQAWSDVLTLTLLRQGEKSEEWQQRLDATRRIAEITCQPAGGEPDAALRAQLEEALLQVGYHAEEGSAIARRLSTPGGEDELTSRTELAARLKARSRLGEQKEGTTPVKEKAPRTGLEEEHYRRLRTLPFGTWFEFVTNQQGDVRRQRLSWYSLITDNALFVNQRGQKLSEHSLDALARLMAHNQARIVTEDKGRLIDRAWQATIRTLRSLVGSHPGQETP